MKTASFIFETNSHLSQPEPFGHVISAAGTMPHIMSSAFKDYSYEDEILDYFDGEGGTLYLPAFKPSLFRISFLAKLEGVGVEILVAPVGSFDYTRYGDYLQMSYRNIISHY